MDESECALLALVNWVEAFLFQQIENRCIIEADFDLSGYGLEDFFESEDLTEDEMREFADGLTKLNQSWGYTLATCGEKIDINKYGILHNRCIDGDLIVRLAWKDKELMDFMKVKIETLEPSLFDEPELPKGAISLPNNHYFFSTHKKDPGQRQFCECMASKDIGEYNTCPHLCEYCYANTTKQLALENWKRHKANPNGETITGK